jgi:transcriptional regulator with XRE-family HTH domain
MPNQPKKIKYKGGTWVIDEVMKNTGWSMSQLAEMMDVAKSTISQAYSGERQINTDLFNALKIFMDPALGQHKIRQKMQLESPDYVIAAIKRKIGLYENDLEDQKEKLADMEARYAAHSQNQQLFTQQLTVLKEMKVKPRVHRTLQRHIYMLDNSRNRFDLDKIVSRRAKIAGLEAELLVLHSFLKENSKK